MPAQCTEATGTAGYVVVLPAAVRRRTRPADEAATAQVSPAPPVTEPIPCRVTTSPPPPDARGSAWNVALAAAVQQVHVQGLVVGHGGDRGPGVVVLDDLLGRRAVLGLAECAVLAHADPVAVPGAEQRDGRRPGRRERRGRRHDSDHGQHAGRRDDGRHGGQAWPRPHGPVGFVPRYVSELRCQTGCTLNVVPTAGDDLHHLAGQDVRVARARAGARPTGCRSSATAGPRTVTWPGTAITPVDHAGRVPRDVRQVVGDPAVHADVRVAVAGEVGAQDLHVAASAAAATGTCRSCATAVPTRWTSRVCSTAGPAGSWWARPACRRGWARCTAPRCPACPTR